MAKCSQKVKTVLKAKILAGQVLNYTFLRAFCHEATISKKFLNIQFFRITSIFQEKERKGDIIAWGVPIFLFSSELEQT